MNHGSQWKTTKISQQLRRRFKDQVAKALNDDPKRFLKEIEAIDKVFVDAEVKRKK